MTEAKMPDIMIGVWQLISFKLQSIEDPNAEPIMPHGPRREDHKGRGLMTADGYMGAFVSTEKDMIRLPKADFVANSDEDIARVARVFSSYCGRLSLSNVNGLDGLIHTDVELALNPAWVGGRQTRKFHMERSNGHDYMTLQPIEPMLMTDGKRYMGTLRWEKLNLPGRKPIGSNEGIIKMNKDEAMEAARSAPLHQDRSGESQRLGKPPIPGDDLDLS